MRAFRLAAFVVLGVTLLNCGCNSKLSEISPMPSDNAAPPSLFAGLPDLAEVSRMASAGDEFAIQQLGADFAGDLPYNCSILGDFAQFVPGWDDEAPQLGDAGFAIYRLSYDPAATPVTLSFEWASDPPDAASCWIGLSDWGRMAWEWHPLPATSELALDDPARYADAQQHCYAVVLLLGNIPRALAKIGFGEPPPPPSGDGYTLVFPLNSKDTYLIDMEGTTVHTWTSNYNPGASAMLLENGHLLRAANLGNMNFGGGGGGGRIVEFDWDNNVVWYFDLSTSKEVLHHDFTVLPNGNILAIKWTNLATEVVLETGRDPDLLLDHFWVDSVIEIEPVLPNGGNIVWEWNVMDHIVQDYDADKGRFADPSEHPELIDLNFPPIQAGDWTHFNGVAYDTRFDQVILSSPNFGEVWVIDHSTTTEEAAGHSGGNYGKGGDLLYRWGNPRAYRQGTEADQRLFFNHDAHWIAGGLTGAGDILIFNNQLMGEQPFPDHSSLVQITPPQNPDGSFYMTGKTFGPAVPSWEFLGTPPNSFFSSIMSSAQRLPNGHTLACLGMFGNLREIDTQGSIVWEYEVSAPNFRAIRYGYDYPGVANLQE